MVVPAVARLCPCSGLTHARLSVPKQLSATALAQPFARGRIRLVNPACAKKARNAPLADGQPPSAWNMNPACAARRWPKAAGRAFLRLGGWGQWRADCLAARLAQPPHQYPERCQYKRWTLPRRGGGRYGRVLSSRGGSRCPRLPGTPRQCGGKECRLLVCHRNPSACPDRSRANRTAETGR